MVVAPSLVVSLRLSGDDVTVYEVMALAPLDAGALHETVACMLPLDATTFSGALGTLGRLPPSPPSPPSLLPLPPAARSPGLAMSLARAPDGPRVTVAVPRLSLTVAMPLPTAIVMPR